MTDNIEDLEKLLNDKVKQQDEEYIKNKIYKLIDIMRIGDIARISKITRFNGKYEGYTCMVENLKTDKKETMCYFPNYLYNYALKVFDNCMPESFIMKYVGNKEYKGNKLIRAVFVKQ